MKKSPTEMINLVFSGIMILLTFTGAIVFAFIPKRISLSAEEEMLISESGIPKPTPSFRKFLRIILLFIQLLFLPTKNNLLPVAATKPQRSGTPSTSIFLLELTEINRMLTRIASTKFSGRKTTNYLPQVMIDW